MAIKKYNAKPAPEQETMTGNGVINNVQANLVTAINDYLVKFCSPAIPAQNVFWGNQNNIALPKDNDYIIFSYLTSARQGTNRLTWTPVGDDNVELMETLETTYQIDFYANTNNSRDGLNAMLRAQCIEMISRSHYGVEHFNKYGISLLYADDVRDMTFVGDSDTYVRRATLTLHLSMNAKVSIIQDFFKSVFLDLKEVDTSYPPKEK